MTSPVIASGADFDETHFLLLFKPSRIYSSVIFYETLRNLRQRVTKYDKRMGDIFGCDWKERFCGKVEQRCFPRGR